MHLGAAILILVDELLTIFDKFFKIINIIGPYPCWLALFAVGLLCISTTLIKVGIGQHLFTFGAFDSHGP